MKSLQLKLTVIFMSIVLFTLLVVSSVFLTQANTLLMNSTQESAQKSVSVAVEKIQGYLAERSKIVSVLANTQIGQNLNSFDKPFKGILENDSSISGIYIASEKTGQIFMQMRENGQIKQWVAPAGYNPRPRVWYKSAKDQGKLVFIPPYLDKASGQYVVSAVIPYQDNQNRFAGVIGIDISLGEISKTISSIKVGETGHAFMVDSSGIIIAHTQKDLLNTDGTKVPGKPGEIVKEMIKGQVGFDTAVYNGQEEHFFYESVPLVKWPIAVTIDTAEIKAPITKLLYFGAVVGVVSILITILISIVFSRKIANPIIKIKNQLMEMAQGGGDLTRRLKAETQDEIGDLTQWFNQFMEKLRVIIAEVQKTSESVKLTSGELSKSSAESAQVTQQVAIAIEQITKGVTEQTLEINNSVKIIGENGSAINQMAAGAQEQTKSMVATNTLVNGMAERIDHMAKDMQELKIISQNTGEAAKQGGHFVQQTVDGMLKVKAATMNTADKINELGEKSQQIGEIIQVIDDIAEQTNLLALNAAIEAARAGEHGKGFAVVADEVRKLAERSGKATKEIAALITGMQQGTDAAVVAMEVDAKEVEEGVNRAQETGVALNSILSGVTTSDERVQKVMLLISQILNNSQEALTSVGSVSAVAEQNSAAAEEMSANSDHINSQMTNLAAISEESAASAEEVAASTEELNASIEEMTAASEQLFNSAEELNNLVGQFRV